MPGVRGAVRAGRSRISESEIVSELLARVDELQRELQGARQGALAKERMARTLLEADHSARVVTDLAGNLLMAGEAAASILGADSQSLPGQNLWTLLGRPAPWQGSPNRVDLKCLVLLPGLGGGRPVLVDPLSDSGVGAADHVCWGLTDFARPMLPGESRPVTDATLARTWLRAYSALIDVNEALVNASQDALERELVASGAAESELVLLNVQLARLVYRRRVWREVHARLSGLAVDREAGVLRNGTQEKRVSPREAQLLAFLLDHPGLTFSAEALISRAWHSGYLVPEQLRTYVVRCRARLCEVEARCELVNLRGRGYRLEFE